MHLTKSEHKHKANFESIGTVWEIEAAGVTPAAFDLALKKIDSFLTTFDRQYSRFRTDSFILTLQKPGRYTVPEELVELLLYYVPLFKLTKGAFTPLIGMLLEQAGYDKTYSFESQELQDVPDFLETILFENATTIIIKAPVTIDIGALGKGYAIDSVHTVLKSHGFDHCIVNAGGDIAGTSEQPLTIGLEHPFKRDQILGKAFLQNKAICSSAGNKRAWGEFHHIMNPVTKKPVEDVVATWVIADSALIADALATSLFFCVPDILKKQYSFEFVVLTRTQLRRSKGFPGELFV